VRLADAVPVFADASGSAFRAVAGRIPGVAAAQHRILPGAKIGVVIFPAHFCRDRRTKLRIAMNAREFVTSISGDRNETEPRSLA
jgi:hypothetical protein